jgi:hypothetical protein
MIGLAVDVWASKPKANPFAALNTLVSSIFVGGETGAWYDGTDPTQRAVNSDGSGGIPATGAKFGWLNDKSGGARPIVQATAASQPIAGSGVVICQQKDTNNVSDPVQFLQAATGTGTNQRATAGFLICDGTVAPFASIPVTGWNQNNNNSAFPSRYGFIAWRTNSSGNAEIVIGDQTYTTPFSSITNAVVTAARIGPAASSNASMRWMQYAHFNSRLSDPNWTALLTALRTASGWNSLSTDAIFLNGDSNTEGYRLTEARPYAWTLAGATRCRVYNLGVAGAVMSGAFSNFLNQYAARQGAGRNIYVQMLGINDVTTAPLAADFAEIYQYGIQQARRFGWLTLGCTYPNNIANMLTFATNLRTWDGGFTWDRLFDVLTEVPQSADRANLTWFNADQVHITQALADLIGAQMATHVQALRNLPVVGFTATPRLGTSISSTFTNTTTGATSHAWDYDNNGSTDSTATAPASVAFSGDADRSVKLTSTNASGSISRIRRFYINTRTTPTRVTTNQLAAFIRNTGITASQWDDQTGNAFHLTQGTAGLQPTIDGNGRAVFDGTDDRMATPAMGATNRMSVQMRLQINSWTSGRAIFDSLVTNGRRAIIRPSPSLAAQHANGIVSAEFVTPGTGFFNVYFGSIGELGTVTTSVQGLHEGFEPGFGDWSGATVAASGLTLGSLFDGTLPAGITVSSVLVYSQGLTRAQIAQNNVWLEVNG